MILHVHRRPVGHLFYLCFMTSNNAHLISIFLTPFNSVSAGTRAMAPFVEATNATSAAASSAFFGSEPRPENISRCQKVLNWLPSMPLACCSAASVLSGSTMMMIACPLSQYLVLAV